MDASAEKGERDKLFVNPSGRGDEETETAASQFDLDGSSGRFRSATARDFRRLESTTRHMPDASAHLPMSAHDRALPVFLRDAFVAAVAFAVLLTPVVLDAGPEFLGYPGYLLYFPLMVAYVVTGGETEAPHGPGTLHVVAFVLALGLVTAGVASLVRARYDTSALGTWRFAAAAAMAVAGTVGGLFGVVALSGLLEATPIVAGGAFLAGITLVGAGVLLAASGG